MNKELKQIILDLEELYSFINESRISKELKGYAHLVYEDLKLQINQSLQRNEPMKVTFYKIDETDVFDCHNCKTTIYFDDYKDHKYCMNCGQKLTFVKLFKSIEFGKNPLLHICIKQGKITLFEGHLTDIKTRFTKEKWESLYELKVKDERMFFETYVIELEVK
jgi:hypothetical protein